MRKTDSAGKKGSKLKLIIGIAVLLLIIAFIVMMISSAAMMSGMVMADTMPLERKNIENTVSVSGTVESRTFKQVSALLQYPVETINVEVGDRVKAGDILATLDSSDIRDQILQQQAVVDSSSASAEYSVTDAQKRYNEALAQINDGSYPEIRNAAMSLESAENALEKAKEAYDEQLMIQGSDKDTQLISAQKAVESAEYELSCAEKDYLEAKEEYDSEDYKDIEELKEAYEEAKKEYDSRYSDIKNNELLEARKAYEAALSDYTYLSNMQEYDPQNVSQATLADSKERLEKAQSTLLELEERYDVEKTENTYEQALESYQKARADIDSANSTALKNAERAYERAKVSYDNAVNSLNSVKNGSESSLSSYEQAVDDAQRTVDDARESYELAVKSAESSLASLKAAADREMVLSENDSSLISLELLKEKLDDCVITAPCDGTVTAINAEEGSAAAGNMFIIEDTDDLIMTASVKEYSISEVKPGLEVTVTVPSLGNREYKGVISKVAPAGNKGADGKSDGSASFGIEVLIRDTAGTGVLIGMTAKCTAVTGSAENVFAVGYDALVEDADGSCYVYTADPVEGANGAATARRIPVTVGFESDAELEIISDELYEGMDIITNSGDVTDGSAVILTSALGEAMENAAA